mgnify:CR=1 FL=1|jgi:hypothetical protein
MKDRRPENNLLTCSSVTRRVDVLKNRLELIRRGDVLKSRIEDEKELKKCCEELKLRFDPCSLRRCFYY